MKNERAAYRNWLDAQQRHSELACHRDRVLSDRRSTIDDMREAMLAAERASIESANAMREWFDVRDRGPGPKPQKKTRRNHPPELNAKILEQYQQGIDRKVIAHNLGLHRSKVDRTVTRAMLVGEIPDDRQNYNRTGKPMYQKIMDFRLDNPGLSLKEVTDRMGANPTTVSSAIVRAREVGYRIDEIDRVLCSKEVE